MSKVDSATRAIKENISSDQSCSLNALVDKFAVDDPEDIAFLIAMHGKECLNAGRSVWLTDYLLSLETWLEHSVVLDAMIDVTLRSLQRRGMTLEEASCSLAKDFPEYAYQIMDSAALSQVMWETADLPRNSDSLKRELPCSFGPILKNQNHRYELFDTLGRGSSSIVFLAKDRVLSDGEAPANVAIKVLCADNELERSTGALDEARKGRRVSHENVARVIDAGSTLDGEPYVVTEHVDGRTLDHYTTDDLDLSDIANLVMMIAYGVQAIHSAGLAHCDLKPGNILVTASGTPKIVDLGLAARRSEWTASGDSRADALGTLAFMSPQQYRGEALGLAPPSDIWALGGILYWLVTGRLPSGQSVPEVQASLTLELCERSWSLSNGASVPSDLRRIIERALDPDPQNRFASAAEFAESLHDWITYRPLRWAKPNITRVAGLWCRRRPVVAALSVAAGIGICTSIVFAFAHHGEKQWRAASEGYFSHLQQTESKFAPTDFLARQLAAISMGEWFFGPSAFRAEDIERGFTERRLEVLHERYARTHQAGNPVDLETLLIESSIALWLVEDHQWDKALPILDRSREHWSDRLDVNDDWFVLMDSLRQCCEVGLLTLNTPSIDDAILHAEADRLSTSLQSMLPKVKKTVSGGAVRLVIYDHLILLNSPQLLNNTEKHSNLTLKYVRLRNAAGAV